MSTLDQDDIDALLREASGDSKPAPAQPAAAQPVAIPDEIDLSGQASGQDDIDALLAAIGDAEQPAAKEVVATPDLTGQAEGQEDIDALLASMGDIPGMIDNTVEVTPVQNTATVPEATPEPESGQVEGQEDIDALLASLGDIPGMVDNSAVVAADKAAADKAKSKAQTATPLAPEPSSTDDDDALLAALGDIPGMIDDTATDNPAATTAKPAAESKNVLASSPTISSKSVSTANQSSVSDIVSADNQSDIDAILASLDIDDTAAAAPKQDAPDLVTPPASPPAPTPVKTPVAVSTPVVKAVPPATPAVTTAAVTPPAVELPTPAVAEVSGSRTSPFPHPHYISHSSVSDLPPELANYADGSVSTSGHYSSIGLGQDLYHNDAGYSDVTRTIQDLASRLSELSRLQASESINLRLQLQTITQKYEAETASHLAENLRLSGLVRDRDNRLPALETENNSLREELLKLQNTLTASEAELRAANYERDRSVSDLDAERMERFRLRMALENREKELQSIQTQNVGSASALFFDEIHRMVRRLEAELYSRTRNEREALVALEQIERSHPELAGQFEQVKKLLLTGALTDFEFVQNSPEQQGSISNNLTLVQLDQAINSEEISRAVQITELLVREKIVTPEDCLRRIVRSPVFLEKRATIYFNDLYEMLNYLYLAQENSDISGNNKEQSERFYVRMFDFLHRLARVGSLDKNSGNIWQLFSDLRQRFKDIQSDRAWVEYRDKILSNSAKPGRQYS